MSNPLIRIIGSAMLVGVVLAESIIIYQDARKEHASELIQTVSTTPVHYEFWSIVQGDLPKKACERVRSRYAAEGQPGLCLVQSVSTAGEATP